MDLTKEECENAAHVLEHAAHSLLSKDASELKELSDMTIHSSCSFQNEGSITSSVLIYALSKLIERQDYKKITSWDSLSKKIASSLRLAKKALEDKNQEAYEFHLQNARKTLSGISNLKPYIEEVLRKASINKGGKIYEHGISIERTSQLLGITQWELSEYAGEKNLGDAKYSSPSDIRKRAQMALEFFS